MITIAFLLSILVLFLAYEVYMRIHIGLWPRDSFAFISRFQHTAARQIFAIAKLFCGFSFRRYPFRGTFPRQCIVISNHQSLADIPGLTCGLPELHLRFVAKRELGRGLPAVSLFLRGGQHALISRKGGFRKAKRALDDLAALTRTGISIAIFPEGTRTRTGEVEAFHSAAVRQIVGSSPLPLLSVAVDGGYRIARLSDLRRNLRGACYRVRPLTVYPAPKTRAEMVQVLATARQEIADQIRRWRAQE